MAKIKKFYAVVTPHTIGIFTKWSIVFALIKGQPNVQKSFRNYFDAMEFLRSNLTKEEQLDFGIFNHNLAWDKPRHKLPSLEDYMRE